MRHQGEVAIVTGASSGIGRATALHLARAGYTVVGVARREALLAEAAREWRSFAPASGSLCGDLGEREFAHRCVEETAARFGRLDVLVNNAAIPVRRNLYETSVREAEDALRINFFSCLWTTFAAVPAMLRQGSGTIVNVSSFASKVVPTYESLYAASKCAMNGFSEGLWNDLAGSGIHVALVHPGPIDTEIWRKGHVASGYTGRRYPPERVAQAILRAIERRIHELVVPRSLSLGVALLLRRVAPGLLRRGVQRMDGVPRTLVEAARERARAGRRLGEP
jgi:hypothetical protein